METERDNHLWRIAQARVSFKKHLLIYVLVNLMLVGIWFFSGSDYNQYFWPKWTLMGWGIGILSHYLQAYQTSSLFSTEKEYEKLKNKE
ncbi:MAG: 2TM domain-containing protein [Sediminibacterium sp.]|nr:2TM domain-containing protein [Sediminibacterium sp.]